MGGSPRSQTMIGKEDRYEIRFSGSGGQGIITASIILAEAAGVYDGKYVCQTESYGPEVRGGVSKAEVVISNKVIDYPRVIKPSLLLAMDQASCDKYFLDISISVMLIKTLHHLMETDFSLLQTQAIFLIYNMSYNIKSRIKKRKKRIYIKLNFLFNIKILSF